MNDIIPTDYKPRSFWERKEGVTGQVVGVALVCGAGALLYRALPYIITLLENTIYAVDPGRGRGRAVLRRSPTGASGASARGPT